MATTATTTTTPADDGNANWSYDPITGGLIRTPTGGSSGGSGGSGSTDGSGDSSGEDSQLSMSDARDKLLGSFSSPTGASYLNTANWVNPYSPIMPVGEFPGSPGAVNPWEGLGMKLSNHQYVPPVYQRSGPANYGTYQAGNVTSAPQANRPTGATGGSGGSGSGTPAPGSVPGSYVPPYSAPKSPSTTYAMTNQYNPFMEANRRLALRGQDPYYKDYSSTPDTTLYPVEQNQVPWLAPYVNDPNPVITGTGYVPDYLKERAAARGVTLAKGGEVPSAEDYGRHGDSMLVHMAPEEVRGLSALAKQHGRELTINPHTGYPEAFRLKDLLMPAAMAGMSWMMGPGGAATTKALTGAGAGLGAGLTTGLGAVLSNPLVTAAIPGVLSYAQNGDLKQALGASAMGYAGGQLMNSFGQLGAGPGEAALKGLGSSADNFIGDVWGTQGAGANVAGEATKATGKFSDMPSLTAPENLYATAPLSDSISNGATPPPPPQGDYFSNIGNGFSKFMGDRDTALGFLKQNTMPLAIGVGGALTYDSARMDNQGDDREKSAEEKKRRIYSNIRNTYAAQGRNSPWLNGYAEGGEVAPFRMESGGFVIPHSVVRNVGGGDPEMGLKALEIHIGAVPIRGPGTGTSDSIPATIDGKDPALVSNQEAYIPKAGVKSLGGPETLYNFIHQAKGKKA